MSTIRTEGLSPYDSSAVSEIVESTTRLAESLDASESAVSDFRESGKELARLVEGIAQESAQARESARTSEAKVEELQAELEEERETRAKESAEDRQRIHRVEERLDSVEQETPDSGDETPTPEAEETAIHKPETALEEVAQLPEHVAEENLSANQQRARFVAKDVHEYTRSVPAGRVIKSSELRRVLSAGEEGRIYTETVSRVIDFLTDLGQDSVKVRETHEGERVVVFTDEFVKRVVASKNQSNTVVAGGKVEG
jgi:predicted transcriptional regulator